MDVHKLQVTLEANIKDFKKKMAEVKKDVREATKEVQKDAKLTKEAFNDVGGFKGLKKAIKDTFTPFSSKRSKVLEPLIAEVKQAEKEYERLLAIQKRISPTRTDGYGRRVVNPAFLDAKAQTDAQKEVLMQARARLAAKSSELASSAYERERAKMDKVSASLRKLIGFFRRGTKATGDFSRGMRSTYGTGGMLSRMFRTIAISGRFMIASMLWRGVFNTITEGFKDLYNSGGKTAQSMVQLRNALYGLRGSFATAFAPILNYVTPALTTLINMLNAAMNAVARFFAVLTGQKTYEVATAGVEGFGDAAGGANEKAKELQKTLLGFDRINKLDDPSKASGGGGGGSATNAMYKTLKNATSKLADMIKKAWATDGDFEEIGRYVTDKLADALEKINWTKIKANAEKIGKAIATFINGACKNIRFWEDLGMTIGEGINTAISFVHGFVTNLDFYAVAYAIATAISTAIKTIDTKKLAQAVAAVIKGIPSAVLGLIEGTDWKGLGKWLGEAIVNGIKEVAKTIPEVLGKALATPQAIATAINEFVSGFWEGVIYALTGKEVDLDLDVHPILPWKQGSMLSFAAWLFGNGSGKGNADVELNPKKGKLSWKDILFGTGKSEGEADVTVNPKKGKTSLLDILFGFGKKDSNVDTKVNVVKGKGSVKEALFGKKDNSVEAKVKIAKSKSTDVKKALGLDKEQTTKVKMEAKEKVNKSLGLDKLQSTKVEMKATKTPSKALGLDKTQSTKVAVSLKGNLKKSLGLDKTQTVNVKTNKLRVEWAQATKGSTTVWYPSRFYKFGGFPEEGPFYMNKGEIAGKFSNGKGVVANNQQITTGISNAVEPAVERGVISAFSRINFGGNQYEIVPDAEGIFKIVQKQANNYMQATGQPAFNL